MKNKFLILLLFAVFASPALGEAARSEADFHSLIIEHYSFSPSKLNKEEIESKSKVLDSLWTTVSSNRATFLPKLRVELERSGNPDFFYYDGAKLLLSLSDETKDKQLAVTSIARSDLSDVQPEDFVRTVIKLGADGIDTTSAAFRVLDYPRFTVEVPAHALKLGQDYSLILMLYQLPEALLLEKAINRLRSEKEATAQKSLLRVLWCTATSLGDETIAKAAKDSTVADEVRTFAGEFLEETRQVAALPASTIEKIRKQLALNRALLKAAPILAVNQKDKQMSKEQIEAVKLFMEALKDSEEEGAKKMLSDFAKNTDGSLPKEVSDYAENLFKGNEQSAFPASRILPDNIAELKNLRKTALSAVTDEVLHDFDSLTVLIRWNHSNGTAQEKDRRDGPTRR